MEEKISMFFVVSKGCKLNTFEVKSLTVKINLSLLCIILYRISEDRKKLPPNATDRLRTNPEITIASIQDSLSLRDFASCTPLLFSLRSGETEDSVLVVEGVKEAGGGSSRNLRHSSRHAST